MSRRANTRDAGEREIIDALESVYASVLQLNMEDVPDLLVGYRGRCFLFEIKAPKGPRGGSSADGQELSIGQREWFQLWQGHREVIRTPADALEAIGATSSGGD